MSFVHLHVHSEYSLLEAACRTKLLAKKAASLGMPAVALTDNGNMFGAAEFYFACKDAGIKAIIGMDAWLAPRSYKMKGEDKETATVMPKKLVLLAQDFKGYQNLCKLSSIGYQEGFYYKPRIDYELLKAYNSNLLALTGGFDGELAQTYLRHGPERAMDALKNLKEIFSDRLYVEVNRTRSEWEIINRFLVDAAKTLNLPVVATNDVHYMEPDDSLAQEVLVCIGTNRTLKDENRAKLGSDQFYFKSPDQMKALFKDIPGACDRTLEIAERCDFKFKLKDDQGRTIYHLPVYPSEHGPAEEMKRLSEIGLERRFEELKKAGSEVVEDKKPDYRKRLEYELSVIDKMGFNGYFLIVQDFIMWAKNNGIPVGPGRGSGAGSLVAYSLGITDLDPMRYNLIFERFLNPERVSMPDFDVDFCQDRRQEVIEYVTKKYGQESVSQIITFGKLKAKAALRDVGRVLGMTFQEVDVIAKLIPEELGISLDQAIEKEPRLRELMESDPKIDTMLNLARKVENLTRHASIHAAGVVISDRPLVLDAPLYKAGEGENVVQYEMKTSEKIGLIKFDFLGLKTLTLIDNALKAIEKNRGKKFAASEIRMEDPGIYEIMSRGDTLGIFQFESEGMSNLIKKFQPTCFEDITAINALYRPGPMDMIPEYVDRKHGRIKVTYAFPELEPILRETYGIIVYQEQVQLIAAKIASYSLGEADMLRRAMGKKIKEEMDKQKARFLEGSKKNGFDEKKAEELFDLMAKFAEYGFNKSHAAAYCVVAGQTAWLKNYYPVEFYAALLSTEMGDTDKIVEYTADARRHGLEVRAPHVNHSEMKFTVRGDVIYFGLGAIKGVGESAVESIVEARERLPNGAFDGLEQFFETVDLRRVNKKVIECLIKAGALDGLGANRAELMASYTKFIDASETKRADAEVGQFNLFEVTESVKVAVQVPEMSDWGKTQKLASEKEVLGFYLSDHPVKGIEGIIKACTPFVVKEAKEQENGARVILVGLITSFRELVTSKGTLMAFAKLEDLTGAVELVVFPKPYELYKFAMQTEGPVVVEGSLSKEDDRLSIRVDRIMSLDDRLKKTRFVTLNMTDKMVNHLTELKKILLASPGEAQVTFQLNLKDQGKIVQLECEEPAGIRLDMRTLEELGKVFGSTDFVEAEIEPEPPPPLPDKPWLKNGAKRGFEKGRESRPG